MLLAMLIMDGIVQQHDHFVFSVAISLSWPWMSVDLKHQEKCPKLWSWTTRFQNEDSFSFFLEYILKFLDVQFEKGCIMYLMNLMLHTRLKVCSRCDETGALALVCLSRSNLPDALAGVLSWKGRCKYSTVYKKDIFRVSSLRTCCESSHFISITSREGKLWAGPLVTSEACFCRPHTWLVFTNRHINQQAANVKVRLPVPVCQLQSQVHPAICVLTSKLLCNIL